MESTISKNPRYRDENIQQFPSNIFMAAYIETQSLSKTFFKPTVWKRYINDIFSLWDISKPDIVAFFAEQVNLHALLWNSRPKYLKMRHSFQKQSYNKAQHSTKNEKKLSLM